MAQTIIVDTTPGYRMPTIYYSQGDIGRTFSIDLQSRFGESLPASPTITIQATKPSGLGFSVGSTSVSGAVVTFTVTETMSNEAGRFPAELKIVKNSVTLFTANFYIDCEANAHPEGTTDGDIDHIMPKFMSVTTTTLPAGDSATYSFDANTNTATFGIPKGADGSLASQVLAADYSSSKIYAIGDYVYYNGNLYRCTTAITTAEAWTSGHWTQVALANDVSDLKSDLRNIETSSSNLFNIDYFLESDGFSKTSEGIAATATKFANTFGSTYYPFDEGITFEEGVQYTLSFKTKTDGSQQTTSNGLLVYIYHTDGTEVHESIPNSTSSFVTITKTSALGKTVAGIKFSYIQAPNNVWTIQDIQFVKGTTAPAFIPHFTAYDRQARADSQKAVNQLGEMISVDLLDGVSTHSGYMDLSGATHSSTNYVYTDLIPVTPVDTIYTARARFVTFFNGSSAVSSKGLNYGDENILTHEFEVPSGIDGMVITLYSADTNVYARVNNRFWLTDKVANEIEAITEGKFAGKRILNIGDSIAENRVTSKSYSRQFAEATGAVVVNDYAVGGSTLSLTSNQGTRGCIYTQAVDAVNNHPDADYDIIMIDGCANDFGMNRALGSIVGTVGQYEIADYTADYNYATILGALEAIFKRLRNQYLNSIIVFVIPHKHDRTGAYWESILDGIREVCDKWSIPVLDMDKYGELNSRIVGMRTDYTDEGGTHPNTLGIQKFYLPQLIGLMNNYFV